MVQKYTLLKILEVFFKEPTSLHFVKELSKKVGITPPSIRVELQKLLKQRLVIKKPARPFSGFVANRENDDFIFYKRVYNLYSLKELAEALIRFYWPKAIVLFGSYAFGEDVESSDIDLLLITKEKKELELKSFEKKLERKIHLTLVKSMKELDEKLKKKVLDGIVLYGSLG